MPRLDFLVGGPDHHCAMTDDTETLDLPGEVRRSLSPRDAGLLLVAFEGPLPPRLVRLPPAPLFVGRAPPDGHLAIPQTAVSKIHAELSPTPEGFRIRDLGSRNGVMVNGRRVDAASLADGDTVHIGNAIYVFIEREVSRLERARSTPPGFESIVAGPRLAESIDELAIVAKADLTVLLLGETGVGKEVFARAVHAASGRRGRFVGLNCAALPPTLLEAELFGVKRGAFTGAERDREGLFRAADEGTRFLDEIGEMSLEAQAKVLRVLATKEVVALGGTTPVRSNARVVCATHRDLHLLSREGRFRQDLLGRIREHVTVLPPLRERVEDVLPLLASFLDAAGRPDLRPDFRASALLLSHAWPFNVRELEALARRTAVLVQGPALRETDLPPDIRTLERSYGTRAPDEAAAASLPSAAATQGTPTVEELRALLVQHRGNVAALARHFAKDRAQLHRWFRRHGLVPEDFR